MSETTATTATNRLAAEHSPYLLQHAGNPVDWYPWGEEAFATAEREDKPIFLSIGYATCHWCHVMEHESFEDPEVARLMNETFVNIKVDREERPDVDEVYMTVAQMLTGSGGWPLTIVMTPDRRPFFAATYLPKDSRFGRLGMLDLVPRVHQMWRTEREKILSSASEITGHLEQVATSRAAGEVDDRAIEAAYRQLEERYDTAHGGFGTAPKFPAPHNLLLVLHRADDDEGLQMVTDTLHAMRRGGIWDHLGFGYHRYSTDRHWLLPHFEKMLYDQAMMALACTEAFAHTGDERHARTVHEIFRYVLRDMTSPEGAFYSAEDADSEGEEGRFYVWTASELAEHLTDDELELVRTVWGVRDDGNFTDEATGRATGANILHLTAPIGQLAGRAHMEPAELESRLESIRQRLFEVREKRVHPLKDDKVLADWNGLMAAAFARAGRVLQEPSYVAAAERSMEFVQTSMRDGAGELKHRWRAGHLAIPAFLDDVAFVTWACLELYEATFEPLWLERALALEEVAFTRFWDEANGGYFATATDAEALLVRPKDAYDGAIPSGNSVAMANLVRLGHLTGRAELLDRAEALVRSFASLIRRAPSGFTHMIDALQRATVDPVEVVVLGDPSQPDTQALVEAARSDATANVSLLLLPLEPAARARVERLAPFVNGFSSESGSATAYVCRRLACELPVTTPEELVEHIRGSEGR